MSLPFSASQDDITLLERKDYIASPKPNGYRSLHLIVTVPIFTENGKMEIPVEVQLRTIAMDFWAGLEHKIRYKKNIPEELRDELTERLTSCAERSHQLDCEFQSIAERTGKHQIHNRFAMNAFSTHRQRGILANGRASMKVWHCPAGSFQGLETGTCYQLRGIRYAASERFGEPIAYSRQ